MNILYYLIYWQFTHEKITSVIEMWWACFLLICFCHSVFLDTSSSGFIFCKVNIKPRLTFKFSTDRAESTSLSTNSIKDKTALFTLVACILIDCFVTTALTILKITDFKQITVLFDIMRKLYFYLPNTARKYPIKEY